MNNPILNYGNVRLLNVPFAKAVADEVFLEDCYRFDEIPDDSVVFDIGGFYGEFGIRCWKEKKCLVSVYEPSLINFQILQLNVELNKNNCGIAIDIYRAVISGEEGLRSFSYNPDHPAGSILSGFTHTYDNVIAECVESFRLKPQTQLAKFRYPHKKICVKMDCEGAEKEIFESDQTWMDDVDLVTMEWHNYDGDYYAGFLEKKGFVVELEGGGPQPRPKWDKTIGGGLLFAKKVD